MTDEINQPKTLLQKDGMKFVKLSTNQFDLSFTLKNEHIRMPEVIDFNLIQLIYKLNPDIYEQSLVQPLTSNEGEGEGEEENSCCITLLMRHFFEDLGLPQKYSHMKMKREMDFHNNTIHFTSSSSMPTSYSKPDFVPSDAELVPIVHFDIMVHCLSQHVCEFHCLLQLDNKFKMMPFMEKTIGIIVHKVFSRGREFIENIR